MKHIVRKPYWDYMKEEAWLNEMSARGMALTDYSWCRYVFTDAEPGEYVYRIELLEHVPTHPESMAYIRFLEENGVECVATYMRWIYLRKKTAEGPFDIYSDIDSKINHYRRVNAFWNVLMYLEFGAALINIAVVVFYILFPPESIYYYPAHTHVVRSSDFPTVNAICAGILIVIGLMFVRLGRPIRRMIRKLKKEKTIRE